MHTSTIPDDEEVRPLMRKSKVTPKNRPFIMIGFICTAAIFLLMLFAREQVTMSSKVNSYSAVEGAVSVGDIPSHVSCFVGRMLI